MENLCGSCVNCCKGTLVRARKSDIKRWKQEQRYDILLCLETWMGTSAYLIHKKEREECIFLTQKGCEIYDTRPQVCREFPKGPNQVKRFKCLLDWKTHRPKK